jgi:alpha-galactosidase
MASVAAYIRGLGLKAGLYTAQREYTCQQRPGSWRFEDVDIDTYCDLGIEYVKTDGCFGRGWAVDNVTWIHFRAGIERCVARGGKPIVLSVESCGDASCGAWIGGLANLWRTTGDIQATWASVMSNCECRERADKGEGEGKGRRRASDCAHATARLTNSVLCAALWPPTPPRAAVDNNNGMAQFAGPGHWK